VLFCLENANKNIHKLKKIFSFRFYGCFFVFLKVMDWFNKVSMMFSVFLGQNGLKIGFLVKKNNNLVFFQPTN
jgi:hypothetical protein